MKYTLFPNCTTTVPITYERDWSDFVLDMAGLYEERGANDRTKKFHTPAISPAIYTAGATRLDGNVVRLGRLDGPRLRQ